MYVFKCIMTAMYRTCVELERHLSRSMRKGHPIGC